MELEFTEAEKNRLLNIIKRSLNQTGNLDNSDVSMLFHWVSHVNDPCYAWVPDKYKKTVPSYRGDQK